MSIATYIDSNCDYCGKHFYDGDMAACKKCMERLEQENAELTKKVSKLEEELANLAADEDEE